MPTTIRHYGRIFTVLASYPDTDEGRAQANAFMTANPNASVLCVVGGTAYLADSSDQGQPDPDTDTARLAHHRALHNIGLPPHPEVMDSAIAKHQRDEAIRHLHAILNHKRTATQSWQAEQEARQWLESIGSEAP